MPVRPFYDPTFDPGTAVAVTYWTSFVGTRSKLNQARMEERLRRADPEYYQEQIDAIQNNINELMMEKAKAARDALQGISRSSDSYLRGAYALARAQTEGDIKRDIARSDLLLGLAELESSETQFEAETGQIAASSVDRLRQTLPALFDQPNQESFNNYVENELTAIYQAEGVDDPDSAKGRIIRGTYMGMIQQQAAEVAGANSADPIVTYASNTIQSTIGNTQPADFVREARDVFSDEDQAARNRRVLSALGSGGGGGAAPAPGGGGFFGQALGQVTTQSQDVQDEFQRLIDEQRERLAVVQRERDVARQNYGNIYRTETSNPLLQPAFTRAARRGRAGRQQETVDAAADLIRRDPTYRPGGGELGRIATAVAQASGDMSSIPSADVRGQDRIMANIGLRDSGEYLYHHFAREIQAIQALSESEPDQARARYFRLLELVNEVPPNIKADQQAFYSALQEPLRQIGTSGAFSAADFNKSLSLAADASRSGDLHFSQLVDDTVELAERPDMSPEDKAEVIYNLYRFANEAGEEIGGSMATAIVNAYELHGSRGDGPGLRAAMVGIQGRALQSLDQMEADGTDRPPPIEMSVQQASDARLDQEEALLEQRDERRESVDPIDAVAPNLMTEFGIRRMNPGLSDTDVQRALERNLAAAGRSTAQPPQAEDVELKPSATPKSEATSTPPSRYVKQPATDSTEPKAPAPPASQQAQPESKRPALEIERRGDIRTLVERPARPTFELPHRLGSPGLVGSGPEAGVVEYQTDVSQEAFDRLVASAQQRGFGENDSNNIANFLLGQQLFEEQEALSRRYREQAQQADEALSGLSRRDDLTVAQVEAQQTELKTVRDNSNRLADAIAAAAADTQARMNTVKEAVDEAVTAHQNRQNVDEALAPD